MVSFFFYIMNVFLYFIMINIFMPFKIKPHQNLTLFLILFINIMLIAYVWGNISVILLLISVCIYIFLIDEHHFRNICYFITSYLFAVLCDQVFAYCISFLDIAVYNVKENFLLYFFYFIVDCFVFKGAAYVLHHIPILNQENSLPKEIWITIAVNLLICTFIFIFNIVAGEYVGYTTRITTFNGILFGCYFIVTTIVIIISIRSYISRAESKRKQQEFDTLQEYTSQIEAMYSSIRAFKHDYVNIMTSISGYLEEQDIKGLSDYFYKEVLPLSNQVTMSDFKLNQLMNIKLPEIKSIISSKLTYAHEIGITVDIEIRDTVEQIPIDHIDLTRIVGIFLDNAIEAALETEHPWIAFVMYQQDSSTSILISNNFIDHGISSSDFNKLSVSTKGANRGIGLHNVSKLVEKYPATIWENEIKKDIFTQKLEIH